MVQACRAVAQVWCGSASLLLLLLLSLVALSPATAAQEFGDLGRRHLPVDDDSTLDIAACDVDGDGDLDLIVANGERNRLYVNDGTGRFVDETAARLPVDGDWTVAIAVGDVDGDGHDDLVCGNAYAQNRLYLNDGSGVFADVTAARLPVDNETTTAVVLIDVDGDGDRDLLIGNYGSSSRPGQNRLYRNDGGTFTDVTATQMPVDNDSTTSLAVGDVDGDGDPDCVVGNFASAEPNRLYLNDGLGTFSLAPAAQLPWVAPRTQALALGDVDGDLDLDLVVGNGLGANALCLNDGTGTFAPAALPAVAEATFAVSLCDVDGDSDLDLVTGNCLDTPGPGQNYLYRNDGAGNFQLAPPEMLPHGARETRCVVAVDVDGDGDRDLVLGNMAQQNRLYLNDGTGTFVDGCTTSLLIDHGSTTALAVGDVDGDGDLDLVVGNDLNQQHDRLYLNQGDGTFADVTLTHLPVVAAFTKALALGDVDGDGDRDLIVGGSGFVGWRSLYRNDGSGHFADATAGSLPSTSESTYALVLADVDGDGDRDLVCGNGYPGFQNRLFVNAGAGTFNDATVARLPVDTDTTRALALGDVDGDGHVDLVCGNENAQNRLYLNDGAGTFTDVTATRLPVDGDLTRAVALGDVDGDGDLDLVVGNYGAQNRLYRNLGGGTFADATAAQLPVDVDDTTGLALGDVDDDGDLDCIVANGLPGQQNRLYLNDGSGTFVDATVGGLPVAARAASAVVLADFDGDVDLDVVFGNGSSDPDVVHHNLGRQLHAPFLLRVGQVYRLDAYMRHRLPSQVDLAVAAVSFAPAAVPLPPYGTLGIDPALLIVLPPILVAQPAGVGTLDLRIVNDPGLHGTRIWSQALLVPFPFQARFGNVVGEALMR